MDLSNQQLYKKSGLVTTKLARDILTQDVGAKLLSIAEYAQLLQVSRGVVQKALAFLEEAGCVEVEKSHGTGTVLRYAHTKKLCQVAGWDGLTINMPVPFTDSLGSLATALYQQNERFPIPLALVYATGSQNRIQYLERNIYDAVVVSQSSAQHYLESYDFLPEPLVLKGCHYAMPFFAYFSNPHHHQVLDGMRVAIDSSSWDYAAITRAYCGDKKVCFVETPLISYCGALRSGRVDFILHRKEVGALELEHLHPQLVELPELPTAASTTPVLLFNKVKNYGMRRFFQKYIDVQQIWQIQQDVLSGETPIQFY